MARVPRYLDLLRHKHPVARFYGAYALFLARADDEKPKGALLEVVEKDFMAANRVMAAQALGTCGEPDIAFRALHKEALATDSGYVFLLALNAFRYAHLDDRLKREDWQTFRNKRISARPNLDPNGQTYANRIINEAIARWPERRKVD